MRTKICLFFCVIAFMFCALPAYSQVRLLADQGLEQRMLDISDNKYFETARTLISDAENSVVFSMFMLTPLSKEVSALIDEIDLALKRGVSVKLYVNTRYSADGWVFLNKHFYGTDRKKIEIFPLAENHFLYHKLIIVDSRYIIEGSINWTQDSLNENLELALLIDSPELAIEKEKYMNKLPHANARQGDGYLLWRSVLRGVPTQATSMKIPVKLLTNDKYFNYMTEKDKASLDAYLLLSAASALADKNEFTLDILLMSEGLGFKESLSFSAKRKKVLRVLLRLEKRYSLIKVKTFSSDTISVVVQETDGPTFQLPVGLGSPAFVAKAPIEFKSAYLVYGFLNDLYSLAKDNVDKEYLESLAEQGLFQKYAILAIPPLLR